MANISQAVAKAVGSFASNVAKNSSNQATKNSMNKVANTANQYVARTSTAGSNKTTTSGSSNKGSGSSSSGSSSSNKGGSTTTSGGTVANASTPKVTTNYVGKMTTEAGSKLYNDVLKNGSGTDSNGTKLTRGADGKVYATTTSGSTYLVENAYTPSNGTVASGSTPKTTTSYVGKMTTEAGSKLYNDVLKNGSGVDSNGTQLTRGSDGKVYATTKSGQTYLVENAYNPSGSVVSGTTPQVTTDYVGKMTTEAGANMYNDVLQNGVTRTDSNGTTLFRGADGKVYATTKNGATYAVENAYNGGSIAANNIQKVDVSGDTGLATGLAQVKLGLSNSYTGADGTTYTLNGDVIMATTKDGQTYAASIVGDLPKVVASSEQLKDNQALVAKLIQNNLYDTDKDITSQEKDADGNTQSYYQIHTTDGKTLVADANGNEVAGGTKINFYVNDGENSRMQSGFVGIDDNGSLVVAASAQNRSDVGYINPTEGMAIDEELTRHGFYFDPETNRNYDSQNGLWVSYDSNVVPDDAVFRTPSGQVFDINGNNVTDMIAPLAQNLELDDAFVNDLINQFISNYYQLANPDNYESMSREQAQARASEMLRASYDQNLENTLNNLNQKALNTGFFGQLPTEALKQQAAAANEVDYQNAINDLADQLYNQSYDEAQDLFKNDRERQQDQINYLQSILNAYNGYNNDQAANKVNALGSLNSILGTLLTGANYLAGQTSLPKNETMGDVSALQRLVNQLGDYYNSAASSLNKYL